MLSWYIFYILFSFVPFTLIKHIATGMATCAAMQMMSYWILRLVQAVFGVKPKHFQQCRCWTAACVAVGSGLQVPTLVSVLLVSTTMLVVPRRWLWFPALKRPAACMADDQSALPASDAKQRRCAPPAKLRENCERMAAVLTDSANTKISSGAASTKGMDFYVVLKYINATMIEGQRKYMCNFQ